MDDEMSPEDVIKMVAAALRGQNVKIGHIRASGRGGAFNMTLPNGQIFCLQIEEIDD